MNKTLYSPQNYARKQEQAIELASLILSKTNIPASISEIKSILGDDYEKMKSLKKGLSELKESNLQSIDLIIAGQTRNLSKEQILSELQDIRNSVLTKDINKKKSSSMSLEDLLSNENLEESDLSKIRELYADSEVKSIFELELEKRKSNFDILNIGEINLTEVLKIDDLIQKAKDKILELRVGAFREHKKLNPKEIATIKLFREKIKEEERKKQGLLQKREIATVYRLHKIKTYKKELDTSRFIMTPSRQNYVEEITEKILTGQNILLTGPTGTGKTVLALEAIKQIGKYLKKDIRELNGGKIAREIENFAEVFSGTSDARPSDFIAKIKLVEGKHGGTETKTELGKLLKAFVDGKIPLIDEIDLIPNDVLMRIKHLFTLKPGQEYAPQENGQEKYLLQNTSVIATANIKSDKHSDREELDPAIVRLFDNVHISYFPVDEIFDLSLVNLMEKEGYIYGLGKEELVSDKSVFLALTNSLKKIEINYLGTGEGESISNKSKQYLKKAILETGKFMSFFAGFKEQDKNINDFIKSRVIDFTTNTAYPKSDRLILIKIFSTDGLITKKDIEKLLSQMDDISEKELDENILMGEYNFTSSDISFIDSYELSNLDPYKKRNLDELELINKQNKLIPVLQDLDNYLMRLEDSENKTKLESVLFDILTKIQDDKSYELSVEEKEQIIGYLYELEEKDYIEKLGKYEEFSKLYDTLKVLDIHEGGKNILGLNGLVHEYKSKALDILKTPTNILNLNGTPNARDLELMEKYKQENPDWFARVSQNLEFHDNYITINLPKTGKIKMDRTDLGEMDWDKALQESKNLGKELPSKDEWQEFIDFLGLEKSKELFDLDTNQYWSSTEETNYSAWYERLFDATQNDSHKENFLCVRCIRKS